MRADDVGESVPARIASRRIGSDATLDHFLGNDRMVPRHLRQGIATQKVSAAVADIGNGGVLAVEKRRGQRRPHTGVRWLIHTGLEYRFVGAPVGLLQGESQVTIRKLWE